MHKSILADKDKERRKQVNLRLARDLRDYRIALEYIRDKCPSLEEAKEMAFDTLKEEDDF